MCTNYDLAAAANEIIDEYNIGVRTHLDHGPITNIKPTNGVPIVRDSPKGRELALAMWGLVPHWVKALTADTIKPVNARSEEAATNGMFRDALKYRRCIMPATAFYEGNMQARKYRIALADKSIISFAGLYEHWQDPHGNELETCVMLTTEPNAEIREVHDRMPVILLPEDRARWLDRSIEKPDEIADLMKPLPDGMLLPVCIGGKLKDQGSLW